jgi:hypothetical protein
MSLNAADWNEIFQVLERSTRSRMFLFSRITEVHEDTRVIHVQDLGGQDVPIVGFTYEGQYLDMALVPPAFKTITVRPQMPRVGQIALVLNIGRGTAPKCIGIL